MSLPTKRIFAIDFMRVISLFVIILFHFNVEMITKRGYGDMILWHGNNYFDLGQIGVGLFVIMSGYSLTMSSEFISTRDFYKKRLLRIFPQFYISYISCLFLLVMFNGIISFSAPAENFIFTLIGFDGYFNYKFQTFYITGEWFLGAIISLYILFPLIRTAIYKHPVITFLASVFAFLLNSHFYSILYTVHEWNNIVSMAVLFIFGGAAKVLFSNGEVKNKFISSILCVFYLLALRNYNIVLTTISASILIFSIFMLVFELDVFSDMNSKVLNKIAELSFAIFLVHHVIIYIITSRSFDISFLQNKYILFLMCLFASFIFGNACYLLNSFLFKKISLPWRRHIL
ncbi:acyltransferase family protein [Rahnella contaminans]|uniref:acyltransferase family protein n=1 Tax=Rahnella contaminans TaxID=2703882 RepID=UPI0023DC4AED|nr:acyltransferase [Rahnella contaminans]MDF1895854.1 acyltransferase [Rahnella contaminans]